MLGPLELSGVSSDATLTRRRERALLAVLALHLDETVSLHELADALWPGDDASHSSALKTYVMRLRKLVGVEAIQTSSGGYRLSSTDLTLDATSFERAVARCVEPASGSVEERAAGLRAALALWRGRPYDELDEWPPAVRARLRLEELRQVALEGRSEAELDAGTASIAELEQLVSEDPLRERRWAQLMLALYRTGRQAEALRAFERARVLLRDQLGIEPGIELEQLERAILAHDPSLDHRGVIRARESSAPASSAAAIERAIERGEAHLRAGEPSRALEAFSAGAALAREADDNGRFLRCAIGASGKGWNSGLDPLAPHAQLLEEATRLVPPSYSPLRAEVLARLAVVRSYHATPDITAASANEALRLARLVNDPRALAVALEASLIVTQDPGLLEQRQLWADELVTLADDGSASWSITAVWAKAGIAVTQGEVDQAVAALASLRFDPRHADHPYAMQVAAQGDVLDASRRGDWPAARAALVAVRDAGQRVLVDPAAAMLGHQGALALIASLDGQPSDLSGFALAPFPVTSGEAMLVAGVARSCATPVEGRRVLGSLEAGVLADLPRDLLWLSMLCSVSEAAQLVGSHSVATTLYEIALPFRALSVMNPGGVYLGSVEHHLGVMASTFGDRELAHGHLNAALDVHASAGATEWMKRTKAQLAEEPMASGP